VTDVTYIPTAEGWLFSVEVMRLLRLERRSAILARTQAANQLHAVVTTLRSPCGAPCAPFHSPR
jgi:hypothetical protein